MFQNIVISLWNRLLYFLYFSDIYDFFNLMTLYRALARKLKLMMFSGNWEIWQVFTKGRHHGWQKEILFGTTHRMLENAILGKNISGHDIIQHTQITTDKQSTDFFLGMIALKTDSDLIRKFKWIGKMLYSVIK